MTLRRLLPIAALAVLACSQAAAHLIAGERQLLEIRAARAPLALSGDGQWRLHVDAHDVLHRRRLIGPALESTVQLPPGIQALSVSGDGRRVALATRRQCVGIVDFDAAAGAVAKVAWRPWVVDGNGVALGAETAGWVAQMPTTCGDGPFAAPVAISSDGRLVATIDAVVDSATNRVVASLPTRGAHLLRLQFVDHDERLLIAGATPVESPGGAPDAGRLDFSVWDLASKRLVNDFAVPDVPLASTASLEFDFSPQTGALFILDARPRQRAQRAAVPETTAPLPPLELVSLAPGACGTAPRLRRSIADDVGASFVVDPYGRWFAWSHPLSATRDAAELAAGARWALVVQDMASGRELDRVTSRYALNGLVATPDGATLFALASQPLEAETGEPIAGGPAVPDDERVLELRLADAATTGARDTAKAWERGFCKEAGEAPEARAMARSEHLLKPLWSRDLTRDADAVPGSESLATVCEAGRRTPTLVRTAGGLLLDFSTQVVRLYALTGGLAPGLPTPRTKTTCSRLTPSGSGFINASGDTLTWRPLTAATDPAQRRRIERRPGWNAVLMPGHGDAVRVTWSAPTGDRVVADYDANGRRLDETAPAGVDVDGSADGDAAVDDPGRQPAVPCNDARGTPLAIGYDWRPGPFGSQRGATCGPLPGTARLVWWSDATIAPRLDNSAPAPRAAPDIDGAFATVSDDAGLLHIVNLALQREIAQIDLATGTHAWTWVLAGRRLVLVETTTADGHRWLRGYALP